MNVQKPVADLFDNFWILSNFGFIGRAESVEGRMYFERPVKERGEVQFETFIIGRRDLQRLREHVREPGKIGAMHKTLPES